MKNILAVSATLALFGLVQVQAAERTCDEVPLQANFDATRYTGTWFEQARDKGFMQEKYDCQQARYSFFADGVLRVHNTQFNPNNNTIEGAFANGTCNGPKCAILFDGAPSFAKGDYRVLETDYDNYSIVYSCSSILGFKYQLTWLLTRAQTITDAQR